MVAWHPQDACQCMIWVPCKAALWWSCASHQFDVAACSLPLGLRPAGPVRTQSSALRSCSTNPCPCVCCPDTLPLLRCCPRGRQNVASYLALDLGVDWRRGADLFENLLLDHDVCSNWGNWVSAAGQTGGRINHFNITKQSKVGLVGLWPGDVCGGGAAC